MTLRSLLIACCVFQALCGFATPTRAAEWKMNSADNIQKAFVQDRGRAQRNQSFSAKALSVGGVAYKEGVGTHANSQTYILLDGKAEYLKGAVGVDDRNSQRGSVIFKVESVEPHAVLWESKLILAGEPAVPFSIPVSGVRQLKLSVTNGGDGNSQDYADWLDVAVGYSGTTPVLSDAVYADDGGGNVWKLNRQSMELISAGRGRTQRDQSASAKTLSVGGMRYRDGVGSYAPSEAYISLDGKAARITGLAGVDDRAGKNGSAVFQIVDVDANAVLWDSQLMKVGELPKRFSVPLDGVALVALRVSDAGDGNYGDHVDWLDVRIEYAGSEPALTAYGK